MFAKEHEAIGNVSTQRRDLSLDPQTPALAPLRPRPLTPSPGGSSVANILALQRTFGNRYVINAMRVQRKLVVGAANDPHEQEAEAVARRVVSMQSPNLQRCSCKEQETSVQKMEAGGSAAFEVDPALEQKLLQTKGIGTPLGSDSRARMEPHLGIGLGSVTLHTDTHAAQLSRQLNARAFTHGSDIYFGEGESVSDHGLLAHELTHVVQQTGGVQRAPGAEAPAPDASAKKQSPVSRQLLTLIGKLEKLHGQAHGQPTAAPGAQGGAAQKARGEHVAVLSSGLEQLRAVAAGKDEALKRRTLLAFTGPHIAQAEVKAKGEAATAHSADAKLRSDTVPGTSTAPIRRYARSQPKQAATASDTMAAAVDPNQGVTRISPSQGLRIARFSGGDLVELGEDLLTGDAVAAPEEAAAGPPGWAVGLGIAAVGLVAIGVGIGISAIGSDPSPAPNTPAPAPAPAATPAPVPVPAPPEAVPVPAQRRWPKQTCENSVLDAMQAEMHKICDTIPGESCSPKKVSPKKLARRPCSEIRTRLAALRACLAARQHIQDVCFGGNPDAAHDADQGAMKDIQNGIDTCAALEAVNCAPGHPMANL